MKLFKNILIFLLFSCPAMAQNDFDLVELNDVLLIDKAKKQEKTKKKLLGRKISGDISSSYNITDIGKRSSSSVLIRFQSKLKPYLDLVIEGNYLTSHIEIEQELKPDRRQKNLPKEKTVKFNFDKIEFQETYLKYNFKNIFNLSYGKKKIIWGQFEPFSPVDFALPIYFSRNFTNYSKRNNRVPVTHTNFTWNIKKNITFDAYHFREFVFDDVLGDNFFNNKKEYYVLEYLFDENGDVERDFLGNPLFNFVKKEKSSTLPGDKDQYGFRLMFYPKWASFGFTYFNGWNTNTPNNFRKLTKLNDEFNNNSYAAEPFPSLPKQEMFGVEFAKKIGKFTLKTEYSIISNVNNYTFSSIDTLRLDQSSQRIQDYYNAILTQNNGNLYKQQKIGFIAFGFDYVGKLWDSNLIVFRVDPLSQENANIKTLEARAYDISGSEDNSKKFFPTFHLVRHFNDAKKSGLGAIVGLLGSATGAAFYYKTEIKESFSILLSLESLQYFSDILLDEHNSNYSNKKSLTTGVRLTASYKF